MPIRGSRAALAAGTALLLAMSGCSSSPAPSADSGQVCGPVTIGATVYDMSSFVTQGKEGMDAYAKARDITLLWESAGGDPKAQEAQVQQFIDAGVDAIVIVPTLADLLDDELRAAQVADIPVIAVNTTLADQSLLTSSVVPDDVAAGRQQAQVMVDALGGSGNLLVLQGPTGSSAQLDRTRGIDEVLADSPELQITERDTANWSQAEAQALTSEWLTQHGDSIDGIIAENDDMALGALAAAEEAGLTLPIVGIDGIADGLAAVASGELIGTSLQHGRVQMAAGLAVARRAACRLPIEANYTYAMPPVTADTVGKFTANVVTDTDAFLTRLPDLVDANVATGTIANED